MLPNLYRFTFISSLSLHSAIYLIVGTAHQNVCMYYHFTTFAHTRWTHVAILPAIHFNRHTHSLAHSLARSHTSCSFHPHAQSWYFMNTSPANLFSFCADAVAAAGFVCSGDGSNWCCCILFIGAKDQFKHYSEFIHTTKTNLTAIKMRKSVSVCVCLICACIFQFIFMRSV